MRVVELGTFLLPARLSLGRMLGGDRDVVVEALRAEFREFRTPPPMQTSGLLLDFHRSLGARQMESMIFEGAIDHESLGLLRFYISSLSVAFVVAELNVPDDLSVDLDTGEDTGYFKAAESALTDAIGPLVARWGERARRALRPDWTEDRPPSAMTPGRLLWWHRIAINPGDAAAFASPRLFGVDVTLGDAVRCSVGNGFTNYHGEAGPLVEHVVEGLMVATQEWLIVDEAQRLIADHLVQLSQARPRDLISVDRQYAELLVLTREMTLRKLVLSEEQRYLANTRVAVKEAASRCWRLGNEVAELEGRMSALRDLFALHRDRIINDRDERRNRLIFVFTVITVIQSVLIWYDFLTEPEIAVSGQPRPAIAFLVLGATTLVLLGVAGQQVRDMLRTRRVRSLAGDPQASTSLVVPPSPRPASDAPDSPAAPDSATAPDSAAAPDSTAG
jgi:hypothetical protein